MGRPKKYPECPHKPHTKEYEAYKRRRAGIPELPPPLTPQQRKEKQQDKSRTHYQLNKAAFLERSRQRALREKEDRVKSKAGDAEAAARIAKLNASVCARNWAVGKCLPRAEQQAIDAAVRYVLAPMRKQEGLSKMKQRRAKDKQELLLGIANGDQAAVAEKARLDQLNRDKQARWQDRMIARAHAGDPEAAHELWKKTKEGSEWRSQQIGLGLGTRYADKKKALITT